MDTFATQLSGSDNGVKVMWLDGLCAAAGGWLNWLWRGYLAPGNVTLMTSQGKAGKTPYLDEGIQSRVGGKKKVVEGGASGIVGIIAQQVPAIAQQAIPNSPIGAAIARQTRGQ